MNNTQIKLGVFGFGCVGQGLYDVLSLANDHGIQIEKICVKNRDKQRTLPASCFTYDPDDILNDPDIDIVVELIDNVDEAFQIVTTAIKSGKRVVTANKKMVAEHFNELYELQRKYDSPLLYEASCCAGIPIIVNLEKYFSNDQISSIEGIVNGTSNFILTKIAKENKLYADALKEAQRLGFAESIPISDVGGFDAKYKACILAVHTFGIILKPEDVFNYGIENLSAHDLQYARERNQNIKLVANAHRIDDRLAVWVMPQLVEPIHPLHGIDDEYNAVRVKARFSHSHLFAGKGAGSHPTGFAVLSDIIACKNKFSYKYERKSQSGKPVHTDDFLMKVYLRYDSSDPVDLSFKTIEDQYEDNRFTSIVGKVSFNQLVNSSAVNRKDVFIARTADCVIEMT